MRQARPKEKLSVLETVPGFEKIGAEFKRFARRYREILKHDPSKHGEEYRRLEHIVETEFQFWREVLLLGARGIPTRSLDVRTRIARA